MTYCNIVHYGVGVGMRSVWPERIHRSSFKCDEWSLETIWIKNGFKDLKTLIGLSVSFNISVWSD